MLALFTVFVLPKFIRGEATSKTALSTTENVNISVEKKLLDDEKSESNEITEARKKISVQHSLKETEPEESSNASSSASGFSNSISDISEKNQRITDANYLLKNIINKEVNKIRNETDNLSNMLMEKIEAANIEGLIDKTVSGIVELKDHLMRMNEPEVYGGSAVEGLRKRNLTGADLEAVGTAKATDGVDAFLKKEIDAIKEANVIPAVLSNGHAK